MNGIDLEQTDRFAALAALLTGQNQPGLRALKYRSYTYLSAYQQMLVDLQTHREPDSSGAGASPTAIQLSLTRSNNWTTALLQAWAMVVDIFTFYQERIANEGFIRTATERRSLFELAQAIGYQPLPGVAASTYLVFTVRTAPGDNARRVIVPAGTAVQSVPTQVQPGAANGFQSQQLPQIFETIAPFEARAEWNAFRLASAPGLNWPDLRTDVTSLRFAGVQTGLKPGDLLLILGPAVGQNPAKADPNRPWLLEQIDTVSAQAAPGFTAVTFHKLAGNAADGASLPAQVFALRQAATLKAYDQGGVHFSPFDPAGWSPSSDGLPASPVYGLVTLEGGRYLAATDSGVYRSVDQGETWQDASAGLQKAKVTALAAGPAGRLYCATDKGLVYASLDGSLTWRQTGLPSGAPRRGLLSLFFPTRPPVPLPKAPVRRLLAWQEGRTIHLAAAMDQGVFISTDGGFRWSPAHLGDFKADQSPGAGWTLASSPGKWQRLAGTDQGVFPLTPPRPVNPILALVLALLGGLLLYIALGLRSNVYGIYRLPGIGIWLSRILETAPWLPGVLLVVSIVVGLAGLILLAIWIAYRIRQAGLRLDPLGMPVRAVVTRPDNTVFAGTSGGIMRWDDAQKRWSPANQGLVVPLFTLPAGELIPVLDGGILPDPLRDALTQNAVDIPPDATVQVIQAGQRWSIQSTPYLIFLSGADLSVVRTPDVRALAAGPGQTLYAGTQSGKVFRSLDSGATWSDFSADLSAGAIADLVEVSDGLLAAGAPAGTDPDAQWNRFQLLYRWIDLNKVYAGLIPGGWLVLSGNAGVEIYQVNGAENRPGQSGRKIGSFTRLQVDRSDGLGGFNRNNAQVHTRSEPLARFDDSAISGSRLALDSFVPGLETGRRLVISGKRATLRFSIPGLSGLSLTSADGLTSARVQDNEKFLVMSPPMPADGGSQTWLLQNRNGFIGTISLNPSQAILQPARDDDPLVSEIATLLASDGQSPTTISLVDPLSNLYDRSTLSISANVAYATHGQTVNSEVLGSADPGQTRPEFTLKNKPLTYIPADTPEGISSTLAVQVNQIRWRAAPSLYDQDASQRVYTVRQDSADRTQVQFGDGTRGARLPGGVDNITASYRYGLGEAGNLPQGSLTVLRSRPPGIQAVANPVPAAGGADPEAPDGIRQHAPQQVRDSHRLVSLLDYEDFARNFGGIAKASTRNVWDGRARILHLTIAGPGGAAIHPDKYLYRTLVQALNHWRAAAPQPLLVASYDRLVFNVKAILVQDPQDGQTPDELVIRAGSALASAYSFDSRDFGQDVPASEVIAVLQRVQGVYAVELQALFLHGQPESLQPLLAARLARYASGQLLPAQLLVINPASPIGAGLSVMPLEVQ